MTAADSLPAALIELLPASDTRQRLLSTALPAGRTVRGDEGKGDRPVLWLSDQPPPSGLWARLRAEHQHSGLWPLLLDALHSDAERPWQAGEL